MNESKVPLAAWFLCLLIAAFCGGLAYLAIFERAISVTARAGVASYEGSSAVVFGFILLGLAFGSLAPLARGNRFRNLIWFGFVVTWTLCVGAYVTLGQAN